MGSHVGDEKPRVKLICAIQKLVANAEAQEARACVAAVRAGTDKDKAALARERSQVALAVRGMGDAVIGLVNAYWPDDREFKPEQGAT